MFKEELAKAAAEYGISLNDTQMEQYNRYFELLVEWNEKINLTAITEPKEVAIKHMIDSITAYDENLFKDGITVITDGGEKKTYPLADVAQVKLWLDF